MKNRLQFLRYLTISVLTFSLTAFAQTQPNTLSLSQTSSNNIVYGTIGLAPANYQLTVTSAPNANIPITITPNVSWISVTPPAPGSTPATAQLAFNPNDKNITGPGVYQGSVTISSSAASSVNAAFVFAVNNPTPLAASPQALQFTYITGGSLPAAQSLNISASSTIPYSVSVSAPWLILGAGNNSGQTPGAITVGVDPSSLTAQCCYVGSVNITPTNGLPGIVVPVVLNYQPSPQLIIAPMSLTFNYQIGANNNVVQKSLNLSTPPGAPIVTFTATPSTASGGQWLVVNTPNGLTPNVVNIQVNPGALPAGQYQGTVTVSGVGVSNPSTSIPVTLNVSTQPLLDLSTTGLSFAYQTGGSLPPDQLITPNGTTAGMNYTVAVNTNNTGNWLNVTASGATPAPVDVNVNPAGLPSGTYNGTITFNAVNGGNNPQVVNVTLTVSTVPTVTATPGSLTFNYEIGFNVPGAQTVSVNSSSGSLGFSVTANQTNTSNNITWLLVGTPSSSTTPGTFSVAVSPAGMAAGQYTGTITVSSPGNANPVTVPVTLNVANMGNPLANVSPPSLIFNAQLGGTANPQVVTVSSTGEAINYTATAAVTTPQGSSWLAVGPPAGPASAATPSTFFVGVTPSSLPVGSYKGTITVDPKNGNPVVTIPVTINITTGNLNLDSTTLSFTQNAGGPAPQPKIVNVTSSGAALQFTAFAAGASWLTVTPPNGTTPAQLSVAVNGANLQPGSYTGQISVVSTGAGNSPQTITVNLTVAPSQSLSLNNTSLNFASTFGAPAPAAQTVALTASNGNLSFTAAASVTGPQGVNWLSVTPTSGTAGSTATNLSVSVNPQGLNAGTYTGSITVTAANASNSPQTINVTYVVNAIPRPAPTTVINGASLQPGAVSPGEIITIMGANLGPATGVSTTPSSGTLPTTFQDVQVTFDNLPAPLLYISATQINAVVPYSIAGRATTQLAVTYQNTASANIVLNVVASAPGIVDVANTTQGAILNQDGTLNTPNNPAAKGSSIVFFATGEGQTTPAGVDGLIIPAVVSALKHPVLPVSVTVGGQPADIQYAGSLPGFVSGAMQVNVVVPAGAPSGPAVPVVLTVGNSSSQGVATVAVQ